MNKDLVERDIAELRRLIDNRHSSIIKEDAAKKIFGKYLKALRVIYNTNDTAASVAKKLALAKHFYVIMKLLCVQ